MDRRDIIKGLGAMAIMPTLLLTGCNAQETAAELIGVLGTAAANLATVFGQTGQVQNILATTQRTQVLILDWAKGQDTTNIIALINTLITDFNAIPLGPTTQAIIALAEATLEAILALFPVTAATSVRAVRPAVVGGKAAKNAKDFRTQYNALAIANGFPQAVIQ